MTLAGETIAVATLVPTQVRSITKRDHCSRPRTAVGLAGHIAMRGFRRNPDYIAAAFDTGWKPVPRGMGFQPMMQGFGEARLHWVASTRSVGGR